MTHKQILLAPNYRQFPKPQSPWVMYQEWYKVVFLHIPFNKEVLLPLIPEGTALDLYEGQAWISVLVFTVRNAHPKIAPPLPYVSNFHEINLRTYVRSKKNGRPGITFLDINASKRLPSLLGRAYGLPYRDANIYRYQSSSQQELISQKPDGCNMNLKFRVSAPLPDKSATDIWLTERYIAYQQLPEGIFSFPIQHKEWPLRDITMDGDLKYNFGGIQLKEHDIALMHYAENIQVLIWNKMHNDY